MKILVITNFYPPHYFGGYELGCRDAVDSLIKRGHEVTVLTSTYGVGRKTSEGSIYRVLRGQWSTRLGPRGSLLELARIEYQNNAVVQKFIRKVKPDIVSVWNIGGLSHSMLKTIEELDLPVVYSFADYWLMEVAGRDEWMSFWDRIPSRMSIRAIKRMLMKVVVGRHLLLELQNLNLRYAHFISNDLKYRYIQAGFPVEDAGVIHWGIDTKLYTNLQPERLKVSSPIKLLFAGQVEEHKGVHTAIEAVCKLIRRGYENIKLDIVGAGEDQTYIDLLKHMVVEENIQEHVTFLGKVPRDKMVDIYNNHHILLFTSVWVEPFGLTIIEAMACGVAVIGSATGGSSEILIDGESSLKFGAGDSEALARQIERLIANCDLRLSISMAGERLVKEKFTLDIMVDQIEECLEAAIASS